MARHMLKYHVGLPLAVFGVLLLFGLPLATAARFAIAAGCAAMMLMMLGGGSHDHHSTGADVTHNEEPKVPVDRVAPVTGTSSRRSPARRAAPPLP